MLLNTGEKPVFSKKGLLTTIALGIDGKVTYALEGSIFMAGAIMQWLRDNLELIANASDAGKIAATVKDTMGVYFVPAFQGLGTPYWDMGAKAGIVGLSRAAGRAHIIRAAEESIAYRTKDVAMVMEEDSGIKLSDIRVDGGASKDDFLMQFQSNILGAGIIRPKNIETTAMGAAYLAGLAVGFWSDLNGIKELLQKDRVFSPEFESDKIEILYSAWKDAVNRIL